MSVEALLMDLAYLGIQLEANGDWVRYRPRSSMTPTLANRIKANKGELLEKLRGTPFPTFKSGSVRYDVTNGEYDWIDEAFPL